MPCTGDVTVTATGDAVEFALVVRNTGDGTATLEFPSGQSVEAVVYENGTEVWRYSEGQLFMQARRSVTIAPGESITHEIAWEAPPAGEYTAEVSLTASNTSVAERTAFEVP